MWVYFTTAYQPMNIYYTSDSSLKFSYLISTSSGRLFCQMNQVFHVYLLFWTVYHTEMKIPSTISKWTKKKGQIVSHLFQISKIKYKNSSHKNTENEILK